jgi:hypothetical protein
MEWFRKFGDIPGVDHKGDPRVDRMTPAGHDDVPEVLSDEFEGKRRKALSWPLKGAADRHRLLTVTGP